MRSIVVLALLLVGALELSAQAEPLVVRGLKFEGNRALDDLTLAAAIATTNSSAFASKWYLRWLPWPNGERRFFNQTEFRRDQLRLTVLYRASGFPDVVVDTVVSRGNDHVSITFRITEGEPIRVREIVAEGVRVVADPARLVRDLPIARGEPFSRFTLRASQDSLAARLWDLGYPTAEVDARWEIDSLARRANVVLIARPGTRAVFGPIEVAGMEQIDSAFIASLISPRPGRRYQRDMLFRSQRALYGTDLFRFASISIDTTKFAEGDSIAPLIVNVIEGPGHRARGSAGFATNDCFRVGAGWTARNFLGNGRVLDLSGRVSKIGVGTPLGFGAEESICAALKDDTVGSRKANYGLTASARRHAFLSSDNTLVLSLFAERRSEFAVYLREEVGAAVSLTRETRARIPITLSYRVGYGVTEANPASFCGFFNACVASDISQLSQRRVVTALSLSAVRQRVNNLLDPTRGSVLSAEATVSSRFLGSSRLQQFSRLVTDATIYTPISRGIIFAGHIRAGGIVAPDIDLASGAANFIPPEQRFYAGGPNDVRGFDRNELGPLVYVVSRDSLTISPTFDTTFSPTAPRVSATGGDRIVIANAELRFPAPGLGDRFRLVTFLDAGSVWDDFSRSGLRFTPGVGLRVASPLGPIRLDIGYNRNQLQRGSVFTADEAGNLVQVGDNFRLDRGSRYTFHFSVGQAF